MSVQTFWTANAIQTEPDLTALSSQGFPTNGDPAKGIPPTLPGAAWFFRVSQLFAAVITAAGMQVNAADTNQLLDALDVLSKKTVPIGTIIQYLGNEAPDGYLICNGASLSREEFPELFAVIGTKCGAVDEANFNLPDLHHRFLEGTTTLSEVGQSVEAGLPNIWGAATTKYGFLSTSNGAFLVESQVQTNVAASATGGDKYESLNLSAQRLNPIYRAVDTVQPDALRIQFLVRAY